ncbi:MAG TPA: sugar phosphate isomerase/epimerase family protein [Bacillota bacterium]|nr:sugar phosphate isomerase/epimerase family protein [Bacillota bacterium]HOK68819.1 sugar phosphate isomerase/epimerase family protein [Bacillota bacterium]HPP84892.1 sugar phosphate isomerase/epimerase family protein [Bacillota bacterium]
MKIGLISDSLRQGFEESIKTAAKLGVSGVQKYLTTGEFSAENMTPSKIKEIKDIMDSNGLVFSAICGDFGVDFDDPGCVDRSKKVLDAAKELGCNIVTTHIGHLYETEDKRMELIRKHARELAEYADSIGSYFAAETGTEKASVLKAFLDSLGAKGLRVNYDPANLVMVAGDDPVQGVYILKEYIVHTHAKDGIKTTATPHGWQEVPLGQGGVDFDKYLAALNDIGYTGYLTIEREVGENPAADIAMAVDFLKEKLAKLNIKLEK